MKGPDVKQVADGQVGKTALEFDRFHEQIEFLNPDDLGAGYWENTQTYNQCKNRQQIKFLEALASCHQITYVHEELIGDPLDVRMFQATKWHLNEEQVEKKGSDQEVPLARVRPNTLTMENKSKPTAIQDYIGVLRRFEFDSKLQRMTVVVRNYLDEQTPYHYFVKGSPEKIKEMSVAASIPSDFDEILDDYTQRGYRVIGLAYRAAPQGIGYAQI